MKRTMTRRSRQEVSHGGRGQPTASESGRCLPGYKFPRERGRRRRQEGRTKQRGVSSAVTDCLSALNHSQCITYLHNCKSPRIAITALWDLYILKSKCQRRDYDSMRKISIKKLENLGIHVILRKIFLHLPKQETDGQIGPIV